MTANKFRRWRESLGWTQVQAAKKLKVSPKTISNYECGVWRVRHIVKLATERLTELAA
jgi:transcriptional regulator with XRE-family HTH domain